MKQRVRAKRIGPLHTSCIGLKVRMNSLVLLLALVAGSAQAKKGCGVELDIGGVCGMTLGNEQCQQISEAIAFLPSALRPPTQAEAQEMMDKKCDEIRQSGQIYLIKKAIIGFLKNPFKTIQSIIKSFS